MAASAAFSASSRSSKLPVTLPDQAASSSGFGSNRWPMSAGSDAWATSPPGFQILKDTMRWPRPVEAKTSSSARVAGSDSRSLAASSWLRGETKLSR